MRDPDRELLSYLQLLSIVLPFGVAFLGVALFAVYAIYSTIVGPESLLARALFGVVWLVDQTLIPAIVVPILCLWLLRAYVAAKLRGAARDRGTARSREVTKEDSPQRR